MAIPLLLAAGGCWRSESPAPALWVASEMTHLTDRTPRADFSRVWNVQDRACTLFGAANETVSAQIVIDAPPQGAQNVRLAVDGLVGAGTARIAPAAIRYWRMLPVQVERFPAWYLLVTDPAPESSRFFDALVPWDGATGLNLAAGERLAVWLDIAIPRDAAAGDYTAAIRVTSGSDWSMSRTGQTSAQLRLTVYDFVLPDTRAMHCLGSFSHQTIFRSLPATAGSAAPGAVPARMDVNNPRVRQGLVLIRQLMRLAHEHRLDLFDRDLAPLLKRDPAGLPVLNWDDYDAIAKPYLSGSAFDDKIGVSAWPAPLRATWPDAANCEGGVEGSDYRRLVDELIDQTGRHFEQLGAQDKLFYDARPAGDSPRDARQQAMLAQRVRAIAAATPVLTPATRPAPTLPAASQPAPASVDMFLPAPEAIEPTTRPTDAVTLPGLWIQPGGQPCLSGCGLLDSPSDIRALGVLALRYRAAGIFLPEVLDWENVGQQTPAEHCLFYPGSRFGTEGILASARLKRLRRSMEDAAYLWLLRQRGRESVGDTVTGCLAYYAGRAACGARATPNPYVNGWCRQGEAWVAAHHLLAEEIRSAVHGDDITTQQMLVQRQAWKLVLHEQVLVRAEDVSYRFAPRAGGGVSASIVLDLFNEAPQEQAARIKIELLPDGWTSQSPAEPIAIAAHTRRQVELKLESTNPSGGKQPVTVSLETEMNGRRELKLNLPIIAAAVVRVPPRIDGDLSDWLVRGGISGGDFVLLGRRNREGAGAASRPTAVFVQRDDKWLYVAFRCDQPADQPPRSGATNVVRLQQNIPCDEDLVEFTLDGLRVAVKSNGVVWTDPPTPAQVAVKSNDKAWSVEMAIPLPAGDTGLARVNFARVDTWNNELSTWAGAARYDLPNQGLLIWAASKEKGHE